MWEGMKNMKIKKQYNVLVCILAAIVLISGCAGSKNAEQEETDFMNQAFARKVARKVCDDGWVFTFVNEVDLTGQDDPDQIKYLFNGINVRHRFDRNFDQVQTQKYDNGEQKTFRVVPPIMIWGNGSDKQKRDMEKVSEILDSSQSADDLLALNPDGYSFEELDKDMFFELMKQALTGEPQKEGTSQSYWDKPTFAFYTEPAYIDGYKFQVAFLQETGCVDVVYIDILYQTGQEYDDYEQLSDIIDSGKADEGQTEVFGLVTDIARRIEDEESFVAGADEYKDKEIKGIDMSRLYAFLKNIHENKFDIYDEDPIVYEITDEE